MIKDQRKLRSVLQFILFYFLCGLSYAASDESYFDDLLTSKTLNFESANKCLEENRHKLDETSYQYYKTVLQLQKNLNLEDATAKQLLADLKDLYPKSHPWYEFTMGEYKRLKKEWDRIFKIRAKKI